MGLAEGSFSTLYAGKTATEGTEPTTYETLTPTSHSLSAEAGSFTGEDIDPLRKPSDTFRTTVAGRGDMSLHWRPSVIDSLLETSLAGSFSSAYNQTLTISFAAPSSSLQVLTDDGATGVLGNLSTGDLILISGAVANPLNAGLFRVISSTTDTVTIYNPNGALSAADAGVDIDNAGVATIGTTKSWQWVERVFSDGTNLTYSEFYSDLLVGSMGVTFPAAGPSTLNFGLQGDAPTVVHADGSPPITKQRGGSDNAASTDRLVHGMDDVREIVIYSPTEGIVILHDVVSNFGINLTNNIRQDPAVGTPNVINTSLGSSQVQGTVAAYMDSATLQTSNLVSFLLSDPDDLEMHITFGATDATAYGIWLDTVRFQAAQTPIGGNDQAVQINGSFSATDMRITRI